MRAALIAAWFAAVAFAPAAWADFVIQGAPPPRPRQAIAEAPPAQSAAPDGQSGAGSPARRRPLSVPRFATATGFGNQVPLSFAVRQIVPRDVKVSYGPGIDPAALLDWKGGQPWNRTLAAAIRPLGLEMVMTYMAVEIRK